MNIRIFILLTVLLCTPLVVRAAPGVDIDTQIAQRQKEIDEVNKKIAELSAKKNATQEEAQVIAVAIEQLKAQLLRAEKELAKTEITITKVNTTKEQTNRDARALEQEILKKKLELTLLVRKLYEHESEPMMKLFFSTDSLSDVLVRREEYKTLQERAVGVVTEMHSTQQVLQEKEENLQEQAEDLEQLQELLDAQKGELAVKKQNQLTFLAQKKQKQLEFEGLIAEAKAAREEINKQIFTLQSGKVNVSLQTAVDMAKFAGKVTGVRPAVIMAVLKVESGIGANVGSGVFPDNMPYSKNREAFLRITSTLGLDPYKTAISRSGAIGPGQFMPLTFEGLQPRIMQFTKKPVANPFELSDAFVATAIFLADRGAADRAKEAEALQRYVGGKYWEGQSWYSERVLAVAKEYESQGL
ncbi:MAG TPA: lytic murein transglycosylase [Candidatus Andersenbacteria bacterium]|nr:lytic murein transglycosylase [Candidatus Andersenbacteria bacterium]